MPRGIINLMDVVFVAIVAGVVVPLVKTNKVISVSIVVVVVVPGTLADKVVDCQHPGVVAVESSIIFASNLRFRINLSLCYSTVNFAVEILGPIG